MESSSSSVSCIHMLCMCSLLSTSFKFSPCGCVFHTFSVFVALSCAFLGKILLFSAQTAVSSSDALQPFSRHLGDYSLGSTPGFLLLGLHHKVWAPLGTITASPLLCSEVVNTLLVLVKRFNPG